VIVLDEHDFLAVMNIEEGQTVQMAVLRIAEKILIARVPDGGFAVAYNGGGPLPQPFPILTPELLQAYSAVIRLETTLLLYSSIRMQGTREQEAIPAQSGE
jgi:hypothetical protein